ncbi:hypothetical protein ARMSODRAFT_1090654 [Armillaria solidipes]|uniref:Uncharacterized protein n=1 Tax=Armillaria solidipes TaxID=1076256 RepID=A0A2H3AXZ5_9AGAR|nr:hypothetical protein ARMSODRAFT_1090654 [Armillaria solidipes]
MTEAEGAGAWNESEHFPVVVGASKAVGAQVKWNALLANVRQQCRSDRRRALVFRALQADIPHGEPVDASGRRLLSGGYIGFGLARGNERSLNIGEPTEQAARIPIPISTYPIPYRSYSLLLLVILECFLSSRLPLSPSIRQATVSKSPARHAEALNARVQCMKIFLGVLETDILKSDDLGPSGVDPRKLTAGEYAEVTLVAGALCWVGQQAGLIRAERDAHSPSTMTATTRTSSLLPTGASVAESNTSISNVTATPEVSPRTPPRCIHEVPSPLALSLPLSNEEQAWETSVRVPVRYTGTIGPVD